MRLAEGWALQHRQGMCNDMAKPDSSRNFLVSGNDC